MANAIYMLESGVELLTNESFASDLTDWVDDTGSWTWHASGGAQYDNDDEGNPLTQIVTLTAGWHYVNRTLSGGYTGTLTLSIIDGNGTTVFDNNFSDPYFLAETTGDYTVVIIATDLVGYLADVSLQESEYRLPVPNETDIILDENEYLDGPVFEYGIDDWSPLSGHWTWDSGEQAADYDGSAVTDVLSAGATVTAGWYRLGITTSAGATGDLLVGVNGVSASQFSFASGRNESYFYLSSGTVTVEIETDDFVGYLKSISLKSVIRREYSFAIVRAQAGGTTTANVLEMRSSYDHIDDAMGIFIGNDAGLYAYSPKRNYAFGDKSLQYGGTENIGIGSGTLKTNTANHNIALGYQALRDNTSGAANIGIGYLALLSNGTLSDNIALGNGAGQDASGERCVYIGNGAGQEETTDDTLYVTNDNTKALLLGQFDINRLALGFEDLSRPTATLDIATGGSVSALRVRGGVRFKTVLKTANYTVTADDYRMMVDASGGAVTMTLYDPTGLDGIEHYFQKIDNVNNVVIDDGATTYTLTMQYQNIKVFAYGGDWYVES